MCTVCGCGEGETRIEGGDHAHEHVHRHADGTVHSHSHSHDHTHAHGDGGADALPHVHQHDDSHDGPGDLHYGTGPAHAHVPGMSQERMVRIEQDILGRNAAYAATNRRRLAEHGIFAVNLVSSPGSGKTSLLVRTIETLRDRVRVAVIEGDQQTSTDADRIRATGAPAVQVNTGKGCHLDAHQVGHAIEHLGLPDDSVLMIENVGNLVCPAAFDLGEAHKAVILSVTEGDDKPLKYPDMFHASELMVLNKVDLLPHLDFDVDRCVEYARRVNPSIQVIELSARTGEGIDAWIDWLLAGQASARATRLETVEGLRRRVAELEAELAARD